MAKLSDSSFGEKKKLEPGIKVESLEETTLAEARLNLGMITNVDPADIPNGALRLCKNARVRFDRTSRRPGGKLLSPIAPNQEAIIGLSYFKQNDLDEFFFRLTKSGLHKRDAAWTNIPPAATALLGTDSDYPKFVSAFNRIFFTNNGVNPVQEIDLTAVQYKVLNVSEASVKTTFRFLTSFYNRLVGGNLRGGISPDPTMLGWTRDAGITGSGLEEWDKAVNETAGRSPLIDSPKDTADFITGLFGFTNNMVVLREHSIWLITKKPIADDPFHAYAAFPGIGCDCPYSAVVAFNEILWLDTESKTVWSYTPGRSPEPIGSNVEREILKAIDNKEKVFASYDASENEYSIGIPLAGANVTRVWIYNRRTKAWAYDEREGVSCIVDMPFTRSGLAIKDLPGTISQLRGTIQSLSPAQTSIYTRMYGRTDGEIVQEDVNTYLDPVMTDGPLVLFLVSPGSTPVAQAGTFITSIISKDFEVEEKSVYVSKILLKYKPYSSGSLRLEYSKIGSDKAKWKLGKIVTFNANDIGRSVLLNFKKQLYCRRLAWRLIGATGSWDLEGYEIKIYPAGTYRK
jgi:hypothetical protein